MNRYNAIIGEAVINNKRYPVLLCEVIVDDIEIAEDLLVQMGQPRGRVRFEKTNTLPQFLAYELN